jgi:hypothetical protein
VTKPPPPSQQQQPHPDASYSLATRSLSSDSDVFRTLSSSSTGSSADVSSVIIPSSSPRKDCVYAIIAPESISGVAVVDLLQSLPAQWKALGCGAAAAVSECDSGSLCEDVTYFGAKQAAAGGVQSLLEMVLTSLKRALASRAVGCEAGEVVVTTRGVIVIVMDDVGLSARATMRMVAHTLQVVALALGNDSLSIIIQPVFCSALLRGANACLLDAVSALCVQLYNKILVIDDRPSPLIAVDGDRILAKCETVSLFSSARVGGSR